MICTFDYWAKC